MSYVDVHSHILPHLDDGSKNMDETLRMLEIAADEGISAIIATPHYKSGRYPADPDRILHTLHQVQQVADAHGIPITLYPGNEIYYNSELEEKFETGRLCTLNDSEYVLVEFSPFEQYTYIRNAMEDIMGLGYIPVLAHVERYQCICKDASLVEELRAMGCQIQVNASSVAGENGFATTRFVHKILKKHLVDYIGTDAHNTEKRRPAMEKCANYLYKKLDADYADELLFLNAEHFLLNIE